MKLLDQVECVAIHQSATARSERSIIVDFSVIVATQAYCQCFVKVTFTKQLDRPLLSV